MSSSSSLGESWPMLSETLPVGVVSSHSLRLQEAAETTRLALLAPATTNLSCRCLWQRKVLVFEVMATTEVVISGATINNSSSHVEETGSTVAEVSKATLECRLRCPLSSLITSMTATITTSSLARKEVSVVS